MTEAVTVLNAMFIASPVSEIWLATERQTDTHTYSGSSKLKTMVTLLVLVVVKAIRTFTLGSSELNYFNGFLTSCLV